MSSSSSKRTDGVMCKWNETDNDNDDDFHSNWCLVHDGDDDEGSIGVAQDCQTLALTTPYHYYYYKTQQMLQDV